MENRLGLFVSPDENRSSAMITRANGESQVIGVTAAIPGFAAVLTLGLENWQEGSQTAALPDLGPEDAVIVAPEPGDGFDVYAQCGVRCVSQGADSLTFRCRETPDRALTVNVQVWRAAQ